MRWDTVGPLLPGKAGSWLVWRCPDPHLAALLRLMANAAPRPLHSAEEAQRAGPGSAWQQTAEGLGEAGSPQTGWEVEPVSSQCLRDRKFLLV